MKIQFIGINASFILDHVFNNNKDYNKENLIIWFEKAFDLVNWNFLFETLNKFILGKTFKIENGNLFNIKLQYSD